MLPESPKDRGHLSELLFAVEAKKNGLTVLTPGGDNAAFDAVIYNEVGKFIKVQIKSCLQKEPGRERHNFTCKRGGKRQHRAYDKADVDILALYAFDSECWWFVPVQELGSEITVKIDERSPFWDNRNKWEIFK